MNERGKRVPLPTLLGDGLLLLCALMGLTDSFLSLYGVAERSSTPLDLCAAQESGFLLLAALFGLAALAVWSLPRSRWRWAGAFAALWGFMVFLNRERLGHGAGVTVRTITTIFSQQVSWGRVFPYDSGLTRLKEAAAARLFLTLALMLLALALGWAVVRARRWWITVLLTLPPLLPGLLADLYPSWPAFLALAACWCVMLFTDLCKWSAPDRRGVLTLTVLPCVAAVLAVITFTFPREGYTRPDWARRLETGLYNGSIHLTDFFSRFDGPFRGRTAYVGSAEEADLTHAGPLGYTGRTVLRVASDYSGRLYLRGSSLASYQDGVWTALPGDVWQDYSRSQDGHAVFPLFFPAIQAAMPAGNNPKYTITIDNVGAVGSCVYAPYFLALQDLEEGGISPVDDSLLARKRGQWTHTLDFVELEPSDVIGHAGMIVWTEGWTPGGWPGAGQGTGISAYGEFVYQHYLDVPEEYRDELAQACMDYGIYGLLATVPDGSLRYDPVGTARQIAGALDRMYVYDPETPEPPEGVDPVYYFLSEGGRGYCMHFASAAALMLRSLGIPARYVSGFTADSVPDRQVSVPDRAAHAWVEVWVDRFGWYPVEVTPAAAFTWYQQGALPSESLPSDPVPDESLEPEPDPTPSRDPVSSEQPGGPQEADGGPADGPGWILLFRIFKAAAVIAGITVLLWLGQYLPKKYREKRLNGPDPNRAALDCYGYLRRMERWGGRMDRRVVELAQKARFSQHILTQDELDELRGCMDAERARLCGVLNSGARLAFRYFWGIPVRPKTGKNSQGKSITP